MSIDLDKRKASVREFLGRLRETAEDHLPSGFYGELEEYLLGDSDGRHLDPGRRAVFAKLKTAFENGAPVPQPSAAV